MICSGLFVFTCVLKRRYVFSWGGGLGPQRGGSSVKVHTGRGGSCLFVSYSRGGSHIFSRFFLLKIFVMLYSIFLTD